MSGRHFFPRLILIPLFVLSTVLVVSAVPTHTAKACLPCNCPDNPSLNCFGPYTAYTPTTSRGCSIVVYLIDRQSRGKETLRASPTELAKFSANPEKNTLIKSKDGVALYKLASGEYQINVGPDAEKKVHVLRFTGCPPDSVTEETFTSN